MMAVYLKNKTCLHWSCNEPTWLAGNPFFSVGTANTHTHTCNYLHLWWIFQPARLDDWTVKCLVDGLSPMFCLSLLGVTVRMVLCVGSGFMMFDLYIFISRIIYMHYHYHCIYIYIIYIIV